MPSIQRFALLTVLLIPAFGRAAAADNPPNDVLWVQKSVEYAAICHQTYRAAWESVLRMAAQEQGNFAVVLDLDETVIDNTRYQIERWKMGISHNSESWRKWVEREEAGLVPGAKTFLKNVRTLGSRAHIVYITNRKAKQDNSTIANLKKLGVWSEHDLLLARQSELDNKIVRRSCIESGTGRCEKNGPMKIIALFGDNIKDFVDVRDSAHAARLRNEEMPSDPAWGTRYFVLPNPMYGSFNRGYK